MKVAGCAPCTPFETQRTPIACTRRFQAILWFGDQRLPGRTVISTHDHIPALRDWTAEHWLEFGRFEGALERAIKDALDPDEPRKLFNLECKMNRAGDAGTHTHWQMLPRYRSPITLTDPETSEALVFEDSRFGQPYDFDRQNDRQISHALMGAIVRAIHAKLDLSGIDGAQIARDR
jgi:diadenosine tetraphosphate (Ap4A) HIT family hydrolase